MTQDFEVRHVYPLDDEREHITDDGFNCPCMPRADAKDERVIIHNSYDGRELGCVLSMALDTLGVALTDHGHEWTPEQRDLYEHARFLLVMHYPDVSVDVEI